MFVAESWKLGYISTIQTLQSTTKKILPLKSSSSTAHQCRTPPSKKKRNISRQKDAKFSHFWIKHLSDSCRIYYPPPICVCLNHQLLPRLGALPPSYKKKVHLKKCMEFPRSESLLFLLGSFHFQVNQPLNFAQLHMSTGFGWGPPNHFPYDSWL